MFRNDFNKVNDDEFYNIVKPHDDAIDEYISKNIVNQFVAFYIASGYELSALWEGSLITHANSALESLQAINYYEGHGLNEVKKILKEDYNLLVVNDDPLEVKKIKS